VQWLFFDDDYVEEIPADKVVTGELVVYASLFVLSTSKAHGPMCRDCAAVLQNSHTSCFTRDAN
jgi:hypothetical protein